MEDQYLDLLKEILEDGEDREDRTGTGTRSVFGRQLQYNINQYFPLITTKKVHFESVIRELLWFISGSTNVRDLHPCTIWNEWADESGELGPVYGSQWRAWGSHDALVTYDQLGDVVESLKSNPTSRRHIVSAWNVSSLPDMALPPCHMLYQFYVRRGKFLDCRMDQRSCDMFLGIPFNIASYAALTYMIAHIVDLQPGILTLQLGDCHIYKNHFEQVQRQLSRRPKRPPVLTVHGPKTLDGWCFADFKLRNYDPHPPIKGDVAV